MIDTKSFPFQLFVVFSILVILPHIFCSSCCASLPNLIGGGAFLLGIAWKLTKWVRRQFFHETLPAENKAVFVTGCDSGFGNGLARKLNALGYTVFAGCLDTNGTGAQDLQKSVSHPKALHLVPLDVRSEESVEGAKARVAEGLEKHQLKFWAVVNNAGVWSSAHVEWGTMSDYVNLFDVNVFGLVRITRAFLPLIRKNKGRVVNVASIAGRMSGPGIGNYAMSKHAVVAFSCALRREMAAFDVKVSTIEPWIFKTPLSSVGNLDRTADKEWNATSDSIKKEYGQEYFESLKNYSHSEVERFGRNPEEVVDAMVDAVTAVEPEIAYRVSGIFIGTLWVLHDFLPDCVTDKLVNKLFYHRAGFPKGSTK